MDEECRMDIPAGPFAPMLMRREEPLLVKSDAPAPAKILAPVAAFALKRRAPEDDDDPLPEEAFPCAIWGMLMLCALWNDLRVGMRRKN